MVSHITVLLLLIVILVICLPGNEVCAFGAGNIPGFAYMEGRAFRHGDIEDVLAELLKRGSAGAGAFGLGALLSKGSKFGGLDIKRVYFGNWLRDYSQAVDIASLKKLQVQTIINLCMALGFLAHGYATHEFEVTEDRLGVYLPTEHIDNPKGYGEGEDARKYHPKLRGPVDPRELEIDPRTGMKNYIANENGSWDTSKALVRRTLEQCIHLGRQSRAQGRKEDEYEAYRLLGQSLHTLEDFSAHSNFCELVLVSMGYNVFVHVGDYVRVNAPNGKQVAPLVTGTFGSSDFIHSLLGEATDHISEASVSDLNKELDNARSRSGPGTTDSNLRDLFFQIPGGGGSELSREMDGVERIREGPSQGGKRPEDMSPQELHAVLWQVLTFRDSVVKKIEKTIEKIPGLSALIEKLMESIQVFIFTTLEPYLKPIMKTATTGLMSASSEVINNHDQYEVFNDPRASDPTHSFLSKDHFNLILNEPAGKVAQIVVTHAVKLIVKAWDDTSMNVHQVTEDILQCMFHPDFHDSNSQIQREMLHQIRTWVQGLGNKQQEIIRRLTKESVRNHENIRLGGEGGQSAAVGSAAYNAGEGMQHKIQGYVNQIPGVSQAQSVMNAFGGGPNGRRDVPGPTGTGNYTPPPSGDTYYPPVAATGQAASYYRSSGTASAPPPVQNDSRQPFPPQPQSSYPSGPPPSFPGASVPGPDHHHHHNHHHHHQRGYAPSYDNPPLSTPPSFPDRGHVVSSAPSFPGEGYPSSVSFPNPEDGSGPSGFGMPDAQPGGYGMPSGGPPSFPNAMPPPTGGNAGSYGVPPGSSGYYNNNKYNAPPGPPPGGW